VPHVADEDRLVIDELSIPDDGIVLVTARFGFQDEPNVPAALRLASAQGLDIDVDNASYFLSRITIRATQAPGMAMWRKRLFLAISRHAASHATHFCLPEDRAVALGSSIEL
jgi:KUP system potassium uptake protein